ncbi:3' terminal RNA ribose 2'-O-methyltransferase Hen1 [Deinobacterium chartae]|uniref:Small RNA 2'-O-methyltransferase n=1 Tax=Deinobacterium chartae TaxID=521158 RepID=A0A841I0T8_9DEIO|nr:3' terminal RNA ribose 2'-O-methyltransferase Hen1 [Deinobacterium chartae]MBB6098833.1 3' terminal RNA ribose 2'-O-methyltransferase Hen1 [Deinobacterium chartae]
MLLSITYHGPQARDLGYLLHKHPDRLQRFSLPFGRAHVFYPEVNETRCTATLLLEVDPVALSRRAEGRNPGLPLEPYVNDRPYAANSFLSVALGDVYGTALAGRSRERQDLAGTPLTLEAHLPALRARRGGEALVRALFEPLGYTVQTRRVPLEERFPEWGESPYLELRLSGTRRLCELLAHLYVLIPVLDDAKHYWVGADEVEKLLRRGAGWLEAHPERERIVSRYLRYRAGLTSAALEGLSNPEAPGEQAQAAEKQEDDLPAAPEAEDAGTARVSLHDERLDAVTELLLTSGARRVLDLGCGEGKLLRRLAARSEFQQIVGVDLSRQALAIAARRLERLSERSRSRVRLLHGSLTYNDRRLRGFDAAALVEVIEHLEPHRLGALEASVFGSARPRRVVVTTPNADYNVLFENHTPGHLRHADHRFEWTRAEFEGWASGVALRHGYRVAFLGLGPATETTGAITQAAVFDLEEKNL